MANQLMGEGARDARDDEVPDGVLDDAAVATFDDVVQVVAVGLATLGCAEGHVADAPRDLGKQLSADLGVGDPGGIVVGQELAYDTLVDRLATDDIDGWLVDHRHNVLLRLAAAGGWEVLAAIITEALGSV